MNCSTIRRVIDELDNPADLPYEAAGHVEGCGPCRQFARDRQRLRTLLQEPARVSAPANFEAMVARQLAGRLAHKRPFWVATGFYLRASAAAAALACMILVIQVVRNQPATSISGTTILPPDNTAQKAGDREQKIGQPLPAPLDSRIGTGKNTTDHVVKVGLPGRRHPVRIKPNAPDAGAIAEIPEPPRAILLVRTSGSEREIAVPMVSVGAQPWFSVSLQTQDERGVRTAF